MIKDGVIGDVLLWRANWMSDEFADPTIPFDWRFDRTMGGTTISDLGCHLFDMALWMVGEVERVSAQTTTSHASAPAPTARVQCRLMRPHPLCFGSARAPREPSRLAERQFADHVT